MEGRPASVPLLMIVPPVVDHCSAAAAPLLSMPREVMTTTVRGAAWNGRSETRPGLIWIPSTRAITGELERLQPRRSAPAITAPTFIRASRRDSLNLKFMANLPKAKSRQRALLAARRARQLTYRSPVALRHRLSTVLL